MTQKQEIAIFALVLGLIGSILLAFSLSIQDAFPLNESMVQFNVTMQNGAIADRSQVSYVAMNPWLFYPGITALILSFIVQLGVIFEEK